MPIATNNIERAAQTPIPILMSKHGSWVAYHIIDKRDETLASEITCIRNKQTINVLGRNGFGKNRKLIECIILAHILFIETYDILPQDRIYNGRIG